MALEQCLGYGTFLYTSHHHVDKLGHGEGHGANSRGPVIYRCMLLCDGAGAIRGLKLGEECGHVVIKAVLNATVSEICQVTPGDVVTHLNGVLLEGSLARLRAVAAGGGAVAELRLLRRSSIDRSLALGQGHALLHNCPVFYYEVHPRDSLSRIASLFDVGVCTLRHDNRPLFGPGERGGVLPGMRLKIRNKGAEKEKQGGQPPQAEEPEGRGLAHARCLSGGSLSSVSCSSGSDEEGPLQRQVITVEAGDTMEGLAARHHVSVMDLRRHNRQLFPLGEPVVLCQGMRLVVYHRQHQ